MANKSDREWLYVLEERIKNQGIKLDTFTDATEKKLNSIEDKLDGFITTSDKRYAEQKAVEALDNRTTLLEKYAYLAIGALFIIQIIIGFFISRLT